MDEDFLDDENFEKGGESKKGKKNGGKIFLVVAIALAILAFAYAILFGGLFSKKANPAKTPAQDSFSFPEGININFPIGNFSRSKGMYVATLYVNGVIQKANETYNQEWLLSAIEDLKEDTYNVGILLVVDSPGGTVYEADEAYLALKDYRNSGKEVWAYFESMAASGGYYIACAADTIWANRNTLTGSIGVIAGSSLDATEFLQKIGIKTTTFTAGKNKNMLNFNSPLTEEQQKIMQSIADDAYDQFTNIVASARQKSISQIRELADGRIYTAKQAQSNGLIDSIGTLVDAQERMADKIALENGLTEEENDIKFYDYKYEYEPPFFNRFFRIISGIKNPSALFDPVTKAALETLAPDIEYPAYLYKN